MEDASLSLWTERCNQAVVSLTVRGVNEIQLKSAEETSIHTSAETHIEELTKKVGLIKARKIFCPTPSNGLYNIKMNEDMKKETLTEFRRSVGGLLYICLLCGLNTCFLAGFL